MDKWEYHVENWDFFNSGDLMRMGLLGYTEDGKALGMVQGFYWRSEISWARVAGEKWTGKTGKPEHIKWLKVFENNLKNTKFSGYMEKLNQLGAEGWECVNFAFVPHSQETKFMFKRQIGE